MAGIHLTVTLPKGLDDAAIAKRAAQESLWLWPLSPTYISKPSLPRCILGFRSATAAEIPGAVRHLRAILAGAGAT